MFLLVSQSSQYLFTSNLILDCLDLLLGPRDRLGRQDRVRSRDRPVRRIRVVVEDAVAQTVAVRIGLVKGRPALESISLRIISSI